MQKFSSSLKNIFIRSSYIQNGFVKPMSLHTKFSQNFGIFSSSPTLVDNIRNDHRELEIVSKPPRQAVRIHDPEHHPGEPPDVGVRDDLGHQVDQDAKQENISQRHRPRLPYNARPEV